MCIDLLGDHVYSSSPTCSKAALFNTVATVSRSYCFTKLKEKLSFVSSPEPCHPLGSGPSLMALVLNSANTAVSLQVLPGSVVLNTSLCGTYLHSLLEISASVSQ